MKLLKGLIQEKKVILLGSSPQCDWCISDGQVDERHCQISMLGENKYLLADLGSTTGTFVNNEKISHVEINDNDFISIGSKIFQLKSATVGDPVKPETPEPARIIIQDLPESILFTESEPKETVPLPHEESPVPPASEVHPHAEFMDEESTQSTESNDQELVVYCLYASEDEQAAIFLDKHLASLKHNRQIPIHVIGNFNRMAGDNREDDKEQLKNANIILVFISADLISNENTYNKTMLAIENHNKGKSLLLPILTRRCMWKETPFSQLSLLPKNLEPLYSKKTWENEDDSFSNVVTEIKTAIDTFYKKEQDYKQSTGTAKPQPANIPLKIDFRTGYYWSIFWKRTFAYLIDSLIVFLPMSLLLYFMSAGDSNNYDEYSGEFQLSIVQTMVMYVAAIFIFSFFESSDSMATPGKKLQGLIITDENSQKLTFQKAITRNLIKYALLLITANPLLSVLYIGAQIIFYSSKHQFFHDLLSKTIISPKVKAV